MRPQTKATAARIKISRSASRVMRVARPGRLAVALSGEDSGEEGLSSSRLIALGQSTANDERRFRSGGRVFLGIRWQIAVMRVRQRHSYHANCDHRDRQKKDAALGPCHAAGEPWAADCVRGEQMSAGDQAAVGYAVKEGLRPVPGGMESDGPPDGPGAPEAEAEEQAEEAGR